MLKKTLPFLIILLILIPVGLFVFFFKDKKLPDSQIDAMEVVPLDAIIAIESKSIPSLLQLINTKDEISKDLQLLDQFKPFMDGLSAMDSVLTGEGSFSAKFGTIPGVLSLHQTSENGFNVLLVLQASGRFGVKEIINLGEQVTGSDFTVNQENYSRTRIDHLVFADTSLIQELYTCQAKKYVLISPNKLLLENALNQIKQGVSLNQDEHFRKASSVAGLNADAGLYINTNRLGSAASHFMGENISQFLKDFNYYGSWSELDLTFREDMVSGSGFAFAGDTLSWLNVFSHQDPPRNRLDKILPANTIGFLNYGFSDPQTFLAAHKNLYLPTSLGKKREQKITAMSRSLGEDVRAAFAGFIDGESAIAWIPGKDDKPVPIVAITLKSQNLASEKLLSWISAKARKANKGIQDYRKRYKIDSESDMYIYESPVSELPAVLFGEMFSGVSGDFFGFLDNELIFSDSPEAIRDIKYFNELNKTLYSDAVYQGAISQIGMRNNFVFYLSPFRSATLLDNFIGSAWSKVLQTNPEFVKRIAAISLQIQHGTNGLFHNFFIKFSPSEINNPQTAWESRLDTTINFKPVFTKNHNTNRKEILLQDEAHNLYLINISGRQLWKVPLKEAIQSEVFQIDYYKNGRLQFLFSTASAIHLLDRNGNYVANYPIMLRSKATNGMALFDYDNRKDYRIFIAGEDKGIYVYDKTGSIVKGWTFGKTEKIVRHPVQHFRIGSRDYIVFSDAMRVYIQDRRGNTRVSPEKQFAKSELNPLQLDRQSGKGARIVASDVNGMIWYIYFNGQVEQQSTAGYSADHFFIHEDIDGDGRHDFIFADQDRLEVVSSDGERIMREKVKGYITHPPNIYVFPGNSREIGIVNRNEETIYLFQSNGKQHTGFPLRGRTPFSIGYLDPGRSGFNLIVGGDDKFLLNYRVK